MTKKCFKENLLRGRGCCLQALQKDPDRYRELILWACGHSPAFDPQCEGTRSWYVYQLISCFPDKTPFLVAAINSFSHVSSNGDWKFIYLAELLNHFALDGSKIAQDALWRKYEMLYGKLLGKRRPPEGCPFHQLDDFEMLCILLAKNKSVFIKIAEDIGRLYEKKPFYNGSDFVWLHTSIGERYLSTLRKEASKSEYLTKYFVVSQEYIRALENIKKAPPEAPPPTGVRLSLWLRRANNRNVLFPYVKAYLEQNEPEARAKALAAFCRCPYPENPSAIIEDTRSDCESLKAAAWEALSNIRHPLVRKFALKELEKNPEDALPVFIKNYKEPDNLLLEALVRSIPVDFHDTTGWHGIHLCILDMKDDNQKAPAALLFYIYETTYCSCCREYVLHQMGKRRLLTNEILQECMFDSNEEIRNYAKRILKRRKSSSK